MPTHHTWLEGGAVLAALHLPDDRAATVGVVICPPIGQEQVTSYRGIRLLAERLAAEGIAAIRFDYPGFGDSTTAASETSFSEGPRTAADALRSVGIARIVYLGLASGALVAGEAAASTLASFGAMSDTAGVVLWDAPASGRHWIRKARALYTVTTGATDAGTLGTIAGAELEPEVAAAVTALDAHRALEALAGRVPALLVVRPESSETPAPRGVDRLVVGDTHLMLDRSSVNSRIAAQAIGDIVAWLVGAFARPAVSGSVPLSPSFAAAESTIFVAAEAALLEERIVEVGPHKLFGIETAPAQIDGAFPDRRAPGIVLFNGSTEHRIGASRYQVELSRELAAKGIRVLRIDRRGTGESSPVAADEPNLLFAAEWLKDARDAVRYLELPRELVGIVGMCVGAWIGLSIDPQLTSFVVAVSPNDYRTHPAEPNSIAAAETAAVSGVQPSAKQRLVDVVKRRLPYPALIALAKAGHVQLAEVLLRPALAGGTNVVIFASPADAALFDERHGDRAIERLAGEPGSLRVIRHPSGDHSLFAPGIRASAIREAVAVAEAAFADQLASASADARSAPRHRGSAARQ